MQALVAREVEGLANHHADVGTRGDLLADRLRGVRADHGDGNDGCAGQEREAGNASLAAVEAPVWAARPLGIDAEEFAITQALEAGVERPLGGSPARAIDGDGAHGAHELLGHPALHTRSREVVRLAHEDDLAVEHHREEDGVPHGVVVGGQDGGSLGGDVFLAANPRVVRSLENRAAGRLECLIERHCDSSIVSGRAGARSN